MVGLEYNTFSNSAAAIRAIINRHFIDETIIDATFGLGVFYRQVRRPVIGVDIRPTGSVIGLGQRLPFGDDSFGIGVVDPPYKRGDGYLYAARYGDAPNTEPQVERIYWGIIPEIIRVARRGIIIKCQDATDGHGFFDRRFRIASFIYELIGMECHDIALVVSHKNTRLVPGRKQRFFGRQESYFMIYKWKQKNPFRPVRF